MLVFAWNEVLAANMCLFMASWLAADRIWSNIWRPSAWVPGGRR